MGFNVNACLIQPNPKHSRTFWVEYELCKPWISCRLHGPNWWLFSANSNFQNRYYLKMNFKFWWSGPACHLANELTWWSFSHQWVMSIENRRWVTVTRCLTSHTVVSHDSFDKMPWRAMTGLTHNTNCFNIIIVFSQTGLMEYLINTVLIEWMSPWLGCNLCLLTEARMSSIQSDRHRLRWQ